MNFNPASILALISELYASLGNLQEQLDVVTVERDRALAELSTHSNPDGQ